MPPSPSPVFHKKTTILVVIAIVLTEYLVLWITTGASLSDGPIIRGPDGFMRILRVEHLVASAVWFDNLLPISNAPDGEILHWTRPFDVLLLIGATILSPFFALREALTVWGVVISPVLFLAAIPIISMAARPFLSDKAFLLLGLLLLVQPGTRAYTLFGRPDHHSLQLLFFVLLFAATARFLMEPTRFGFALLAGVATGMGLWVSIEALLGIGVGFLVFGMFWIRTGDARIISGAKKLALTAFFIVTLGLILERRPVDWLAVEFDRLSVVHWVLILLLTLGSIFLASCSPALVVSWQRRAGLVGLFAVTIVIGMGLVFPDFLHGPFAQVDPELHVFWLSHVSELRNSLPVSQKSAMYFFGYFGPTVTAITFLFWLTRTHKSQIEGDEIAIYLPFLLIFAGMAVYQLRWSIYLGPIVTIVWVHLLGVSFAYEGKLRLPGGRQFPARSIVFLACLMWYFPPWIALHLLSAEETDAQKQLKIEQSSRCDPKTLIGKLDFLSDQPLIILTGRDNGPELAFHTGNRIVAGPYHRNAQGIKDIAHFFTAESDTAAWQIIKDRQVDAIIYCPHQAEIRGYLKSGSNRLIHRLENGDPPDWLATIDGATAATGDYRLYSVQRK